MCIRCLDVFFHAAYLSPVLAVSFCSTARLFYESTSSQEQGRIEPILSMAPEEAKSQPLVMVNVYTRGVLSGKMSQGKAWKCMESWRQKSDRCFFLRGCNLDELHQSFVAPA